ncbi:MAG: s-methyl-5-thioribose-1-phosphate isomerase [Anaerorhabdus sp.]
MKRADYDLAMMLKYENIAWYEDGCVKILDRRVYPMETRYEICRSYQEVSLAIKNMVTQSEGPYLAAAMGMALAMSEATEKSDPECLEILEDAAKCLSSARPTTSNQMKGIVYGALELAKSLISEGYQKSEIVSKLQENAINYVNQNYIKYAKIAKYLVDEIPDNGTVMTQCFGGTIVGLMLRECKAQNKKIRVICAETRPYYQGARLTASVACDMGFDVTVICDNMPAYVLKDQKVDLFTSASDVITMDGHIINKIGTFQIALACKEFNIPYYCTGTPDITHKDLSSVKIEKRNPELVLESLGTKITMDKVKGYYPAFDITPPKYCTKIITDKGLFSCNELDRYFD